MLYLGISEIGKTYFCFQKQFPYSADVKPIVNKDQLDFIYLLAPLSMLSLCVKCNLYASIWLYQPVTGSLYRIRISSVTWLVTLAKPLWVYKVPTLSIFNAIGQLFMVVNGQILNNLAGQTVAQYLIWNDFCSDWNKLYDVI